MKTKWYTSPPYNGEGWQIVNEKGELVATFEDQKECEIVVELYNQRPESYITLFQRWEEDDESKTGWSTWGWEDENSNLFDESCYELEEVLEKDGHGHITKARFKFVG